MSIWEDVMFAGPWLREQRERRKWSQEELANRTSGLLRAAGSTRVVKQQSIDQLERKKLKTVPDWFRYARQAVDDSYDETAEDPAISLGRNDDTVKVKLLPTFVGAGGYSGTGEGDGGTVSFSRHLIERELRAPADQLLAIEVEGNSMEPDYLGGDQILVDTRRRNLSSPGAFCLWDGDGYVIKYLERVHDEEPAKVRVISRNSIYEPKIRLLDEIDIRGRVVWFGRQVR